MRILILVIVLLSSFVLGYGEVPDDGSRAVQEKLDEIYLHVDGVSEGVRNVTYQLNTLCLELASIHGMAPCEAFLYCKVTS